MNNQVESGLGGNFIHLLQDPTNTVAINAFGQLIEVLPSSMVLMTFDNEGKPHQTWINSKATLLLGETPDTLLRTPNPTRWTRWLHPSDLSTYTTAYDELFLKGGSSEQVFRVLDLESRENADRPSNYLWVAENRTLITDPSTNRITGMLSVLQDITRVGKYAYQDGLTGLYNRRFLEEHWPHEYNRAHYQPQRSNDQDDIYEGITLCDVDHLKKVNDDGGHLEGDKAIIATADFLSETLRDDDIAVRWGGDEFLILSPGSNLVSARGLATRLHANYEKAAFQFSGVTLTMSIGFHSANLTKLTMSSREALELLVKRADVALYEAKAAGRNCVKEYGQI